MAVLAVLISCSAPPAYAAWSDTETASTTTTAATVVTPTLRCRSVAVVTVEVSWDAATSPTAMGYTATINGTTPLTVTGTGATRTVTVAASLFASGTRTVRVVAALPGTTWVSGTATQDVTFSLAGTVVGCG